jgi:putative nucleotidyltransferase with HDIG domain
LAQNKVANMPSDVSEQKRDFSRWAPWYIGAITLLGIAILLVALTRLPAHRLGLLLFAGMAAIAELGSVELFISSRHSHVSVSSMIALASILALGPFAGVLVYVTSGMMTGVKTAQHGRRLGDGRVAWLRRLAFNTGMFVTAGAAASGVYVLLGGTPERVSQTSNILPLVAAATADTLVNVVILIGVLTLQTGRRPLHIWKQDLAWAAPICIAGGVIGGGVLALAYEMFHWLGLVVFFLPILATTYSLRLYAANMKVVVNQLEEMNRTLYETNLGLLETLGAVIDADDLYTYGHSAQVSVYAGAIAEKMGLSSRAQSLVIRAALVHDIGKVGVMDSLISKPGPLTVDEYHIVKRHPVIGAEIVGRTKGLRELVPLVRHHHERWDGTGYPDGLAGQEIPLGARILAVADCLDAMCSDRPYHPTRHIREVMDTFVKDSGKQFDPQVVKALWAVVEERGPGFLKNSAASVDETRLAGLGSVNTQARYLKKSMLAAG